MDFFSFPCFARHATIALLLAGASTSACAEWLLDVDAGAIYDSNVNRAYARADIRADAALTLNAAAAWYQALSGADGLSLGANARGETYDRFQSLNMLGVGGTAAYRHKFGLGYAAPWVMLSAAIAHDDYRGDIRDNDRVALVAAYFAKTDGDGKALLTNLPPRQYALRVWHPQLELAEETTRKNVDASQARRIDVTWEVNLKREVKVRRAPTTEGRGRY